MLLLAALLPILAAQPDRYGLPSCEAPHLEFAARQAFVLCHDANRKVPAWTAYELTPAQLEQPARSRPSRFHSDAILQSPGATNADYTRSGFHRGHLVPARDLANSPQTFVLSNAAPQNPSLNMGRWRQLENTVRMLAASSDALYIVTGTLFQAPQPQTIGPNQVGVPTHFYKAILAVQGSRKIMFAVILPNSAHLRQPISHFAASVDEIETLTGLDLFPTLPIVDQQSLEATATPLP